MTMEPLTLQRSALLTSLTVECKDAVITGFNGLVT